jgi:hypothetical protein
MKEIKKYKIHIVWVVAVIAALAGGFVWGQSMGSGSRSGFAGAGGAFSSSTRRMTGATNGGGFVSGEVTAMDSSSITLQLPTGSSEVVFYSSSTSVTEPTVVPVSKLAVGTNVMIGGTTNSDGSLTAQSIQVRAAGATGGAGSGRGIPSGQTGQ